MSNSVESCNEEINDRLTISRVVSDLVIKGIVDAVTQEAAEKIAQKEVEVAKLEEMLHVYRVGGDENEFLPMQPESKGTEDRFIEKGAGGGVCPNFLEAVVEHDGVEKSLGILRGATQEQFNKLKNEVEGMRGCSSIKRIGSGSQLLGDKLQDDVSDRWIDVDRWFDRLKGTVETVFQQVEEMVSSAKASVCEWQQEQDFKAEIEALVMRNCIWSIEEKNGDRFYGNKNLNWHGRMEEISSLREELDTISKSLSVSDVGHLSSHGSLEVDEESNNHKKGESHHKFLNNLKSSPSLSLISSSNSTSTSTSTSSSLWEVDVNRLTHMSTDELKSYLTKLKRSHESKVLHLTEHIYSLRREFFKEMGSSLPSKKSKEFDMLRRRISEVITKLDEVLVEKEEVATCGNNEESLSSLKERLELLISENHHLRDLLANKEREVQCLSLQVSEDAEKMSEHSMAEAKLLKTTANLKSAVEDADIEALIVEDTYACILRGMMDQIKCIAEESHLENVYIQEIYKSILKEASHSAQPASQSEIEDLNMEYTIMQALVMRNCIWSIEEKNGDRFYGNKNLNWDGRMEEISSLREELDTISKSLSVSDVGHLSSHGSLGVDEGNNNYKKGDRSHHKVLNNLKSSPSLSLMSSSTSTSSSLSEENGKHESERSLQERFDVNWLAHMSTDELKSYLTKLKRSHESEVQDLTELIFSLKRGSSLPSKKSKEFDMLRRRISEVITKLDEVLVEKEEVATCGNNEESLSSLKERLELLISENRHLREAMKDAEQNLNNLNMKCREENELRVLLEMTKLEKEKQCEEKEQLAHDATAALENERERYELAAQELHNFKGQTFRILKLISDSIEESKATKQHLVDALEQNERYKADVCKLDQKLELATKELCEERRMRLDANQEKCNVFSLFEAKEREHKQQLESMALNIRELLKAVAEFECRVTQDITLFS